jgi:DnaK suppressor protein
MTKKQLETLKKLLLEEKKKILAHLNELQSQSQATSSDVSGDEVDVASISIDSNTLRKIGTRESKYLSEIERALKKMEADTYGVCEMSGEDIPYERLLARPTAKYTIECQEIHERQEKQYSDDEEGGDGWESEESTESPE